MKCSKERQHHVLRTHGVALDSDGHPCGQDREGSCVSPKMRNYAPSQFRKDAFFTVRVARL